MTADTTNTLRTDLTKASIKAVVLLLLIPLLTYGFVRYAQRKEDAAFLQLIETRFLADANLNFADKQARIDFYRARPLSTICANQEAQAQSYKDNVCEPYGEVWQFHMVRKLAGWTLVLSAVSLLLLAGLAFLAHKKRAWQYPSFVAGWRFVVVFSVATVLVQGFFLVWLSFWLTAYFFKKYFVKLIVLAGLLALGAAAMIVLRLFQRPVVDNSVSAEFLSEADAPLLWRRIKHLASRLRTDPPDHVLVGIDSNFFVTQAPLRVGTKTTTGRSLYMSIPLLRILTVEEADAVLGHELAHFRGADTQASAALGPKLQQYDHYAEGVGSGGLAVVVHPLLQLYRAAFQLALSKDSREREFKADHMAGKLVSAPALAHALIKVAAYSNYRSTTEQTLFSSEQQLDSTLGIAEKVSHGLRSYAASDDFMDDMHTAQVPHPYDTHPQLQQRMQQLGHVVPEEQYGVLLAHAPIKTWAQEIFTADILEARLWAVYEQQFATHHDQALAYRYEPASETQRAHVLKYFPPLAFALKDATQVEVNYQGIVPAGEPLIDWDAISKLQYNDSSLGDSLSVTLNQKSLLGAKTVTVKLKGIGKQKDDFNAALGHYWQRHQIMRSQQ
jgi:Zn-dependent protease with chaperone function